MKSGTGLVASQLNVVYVHLPDLVIVKGHKDTDTEKRGAKNKNQISRTDCKSKQIKQVCLVIVKRQESTQKWKTSKTCKEVTLEEEHKLEEC